MISFLLMASVWGGNPFYGVDYVPAMRFKTKEACELVVKDIQAKQEKSKAYCLEVKD